MIKTKRLNIYVASSEEMENFISAQTDAILRAAYKEMLDGCLKHPSLWEWYAIWMIELKDGTHIGELCFKGVDDKGVTEIGYGIKEEYQGNGYATEAVQAVTDWALKQPNVTAIEAETELENKASLRVLEKSGFVATGKIGNEGLKFILHKINKKAILYIHGKNGKTDEANHYKKFFTDYDVFGIDYVYQTPWKTKKEFLEKYKKITTQYDDISIIANSIGAYFAMNALANENIKHAFFISPIVDMERLIIGMMNVAGISEEELAKKKEIITSFGETLSWEYLCYVRLNPIVWHVPTDILYGENDNLTSAQTISDFAKQHNATLSIMPDGEHWFHTDKEMKFLDNWLKQCLTKQRKDNKNDI